MTDSVLIAHRGMEDTHPENTLLAFKAALKLGMGVEFDLSMTSDNHVVVIHDDTVDRTTGGTGRVSQMTLAELQELDAGSWKDEKYAGAKIPTFEEVLGLISAHSGINPVIALDVRTLQPGIIKTICEALDNHKLMDRTVGIGVIMQSVDVRRRFYEGSAQFQCGALAETSESLPIALNDPYSNWIYARYVPSAEDVQSVHEKGKKILVSGDAVSADINEAQRAAEVGPDAVLTWHPTELHRRLS